MTARSERLQGTVDVLILKTLAWNPMHGYAIAKFLADTSRGELTVEGAALYQGLHRLERKGLIRSRWGTSDTKRRVRIYDLTPKGRAQLVAEADGWKRHAAAGMAPEAARRRALKEFGDADGATQYGARQDVAGDRRLRVRFWIEELGSDLRIAARTLARTPTVTAVVLLTFAVGVGSTTAVFSIVHAMFLRRLPYGAEQTLVYLPAADNGVIRPGLGGGRHSAAALVALRERTRSFSGIAGAEQGNIILTVNGEPEQVTAVAL